MNLDHLNSTQKEAVLATDGPMMILAGAGSGKTRTLVSKISYLLDEKRLSPYKLLAVTFSNKAAKEMRERVAKETKFDVGALQITTFHAFCARVLRDAGNYLGLSRNFTIYDDGESRTIIKNLLGRRGVSPKEISPYEIMAYISSIKNLGYYKDCDSETADEVDTEDPFFSYYLEYEQELHKSNAVDFGGLIVGVIELFHKHPQVLERYQKRFEYVLVDEYQDTNRSQFKLIKLISDSHKNICVVGDEDQSIYSWRGADIRNILDFEKNFPEAQILKLEQNYRSSKNIIEAASKVIEKNVARKGKNMWTENHEGDLIQMVELGDDREEADFISTEITKLTQSGVDPKDIAVFYRNNAQSRQIEDALRKIKIPYRVVAGIKFYERKEIKDLLSYIRIVVNGSDSLALSRVINVPARGLGIKSLRKLEQLAIDNQCSLWEAVVLICENPEEYKHLKLSSRVRSSLDSFIELIQDVKRGENEGIIPSNLYEKLLYESGYYDMLESEKSYESQARLENLDELYNAIKQFEETNEEPSLLTFLESITLDTTQEEDSDQEVSLMTIHGAKGLEYPYVFVTGNEETVFPSFQSLELGDEAIEEERRLFYVAMTRAMKKLYLTYAQGRMLWGQVRFNGPSRFLDEIEDQYFDFIQKGRKGSRVSGSNESQNSWDDFSQESDYHEEKTFFVDTSTKKKKATYEKGNKVKHQLYGEGKVLQTMGAGADEKVVIQFAGGTRKKFMVKFAPIELV